MPNQTRTLIDAVRVLVGEVTADIVQGRRKPWHICSGALLTSKV